MKARPRSITTTMKELQSLKKMRLFKHLSNDELEKAAKAIQIRKCRKGKTIVSEGGREGAVYIVQCGELKVTTLLRGKRRELGTFRTGDHFGELSFIDRKPRSATIYATEDSELLVLTRRNFEKLLHVSRLQIKLLQALLEDLSQKLRERHDVLDFEMTDLLPVGVFEMDRSGNITYTNRTGLEFFGHTSKDFEMGLSAFDLIVPLERLKAKQNVRKILRGQKLGVNEYEGLRRDGSTFPFLVHSDPIIKGKKVVGLRGTLIDITDQKHAEDSLRMLQKAVETMKIGVTLSDSEGRIIYSNSAEARMHGYRVEELMGKEVRIFAPREIWSPMTLKEMAEIKDEIRESVNIRKDGTRFPVQMISTVVADSSGNPIGVVTSCEDITERKRIETELKLREEALRKAHGELEVRVRERTKELEEANDSLREQMQARGFAVLAFHESERRFRDLLENVQLISVLLDQEGKVLFCNDYLLRLTGYQREEVLDQQWFDLFIPPEQREILKSRFSERIVNGTISPHYENLIWTRRKERRLISWDNTVLRDSSNNIVGTASIGTDITHSREAEERLRNSEERYRTLFEESKDVIFISTINGRFLDINPAGVELFGYASKAELLEIDIARDLFGNAEERENFRTAFLRDGFVKDFECRLKRKDGRMLIMLETATAVRNEKGELIGYRGILRDITERKQAEEKHRELEERLQKGQLMEAMGRLLAGVAHEVRNPLNAIQVNAEAIQKDLGANQPFLEIIRSQVNRLSNLMSNLLELGRPVDQFTMEMESLPELCASAIRLWMQTADHHAYTISLIVPENASTFVKMDGPRMQQVLVNLLDNAAQHCLPGNEIRVCVQQRDRVVILSVSDHGEGIPPGNISRLFEPFFTTRRRGTGLGLSLVKHIVESHGGKIEVYNNAPYPGCTFEITFT